MAAHRLIKTEGADTHENDKSICLLGIALVAIVMVLLLVKNITAPAGSTTGLTGFAAPVSAPTALPSDAIPLKSVADLTSLNATVKLDVNGLIDGQRAQGDLNGVLTSNDQQKSKITVSGSLLGDIAAKVGGSLVSLFTPSKVDLYKVPQGAYVVANGLFPVCVKPEALNATSALDEISPTGLLTMLTSSDVARGKLVGEETLTARPSSTTSSTEIPSSPPRKTAPIRNCKPLASRCGRQKTPTCTLTQRVAIRWLFAAATAAPSNPSSSKGTLAWTSH